MSERSSRRRLLVLATTYPRWAGDHEPGFVHELARRLTPYFEVVAVVPHATGALREEMLDGVRVIRYRYASDGLETLVNDGGITTHLRRSPWKWLLVPGFMVMHLLAARRLVTRDTVVHAHWIVLPGLVARFLAAPYVVTSHGADLFTLRGRIATAVKRYVLARARTTTVVSQAMVSPAQDLMGGAAPNVSPMGVDLIERFSPPVNAQRDIDHILFVGRLVDKKGVDILLRAMPAVLERRPLARLTIIGHGPLAESLRKLSSELGIDTVVDFLGPLPASDLPAWYGRVSVFAAPFRSATSGDQEGLGLVLVEALGCGCPVVTTDIPAAADVTRDIAGVRSVPSDDISSLSEALVQTLEDVHSFANVSNSRSLLIDRFDWSRVADRYAAILGAVPCHARRP
jgi:glycosyltransferase involved in cell wall biosynthesis